MNIAEEKPHGLGDGGLQHEYIPSLVSVVIPARNAAHFLASQLEALSRQNYSGDWEVIVADNNSTDCTAAVASEWVWRLPKLRIVEADDRQGVNHARNVGAAAARGDFLVFCDADDAASAGWLRAMAEGARTADLVGGYLDQSALNTVSVRRWRPSLPRRKLPTVLGYLPFAVGASLGVRADVYSAIGGFNEDYVGGGDEVEFCWRAQLARYVIGCAPDAVMHYRLRDQLWPLAKQAYGFGRSHAQLMRDFQAHGLGPVNAWAATQSWYKLIRRLPELSSRDDVGMWVYGAALQAGRLAGSVHYRVFCL